MTRTFQCAPSLTDRGVIDFARQGFLMLERVVPESCNRRVKAYLDAHDSPEPSGILQEPWFIDEVILQPQVVGAVRSLLGQDFGLPVLMSNHRRRGPIAAAFGWHVDGGSLWRPEIQDLQVFYYPQDTPEELGPTHLLPGSHLVPNAQRAMAHLGALRGERSSAAPAGTIFITMYRIWHRASPSSVPCTRDLLKYCYYRTSAPQRDWLPEPGFDIGSFNFEGPSAPFGEQFQDSISAAEIYAWLCGAHEHFRLTGGQGWPVPAGRIAGPYGLPRELERVSSRS
jgi:hypothetical protein